jgi:hypothetical protein
VTLIENEEAANRRKIDIGCALIRLKQRAGRQFEREAYRLFKVVYNGQRADLMRVAALYGERPDIWQRVSWRALVLLAKPSMPADLRHEFEARIKAGALVTGKEIAARRKTLLAAQIFNASWPTTP